jgi:hypothetical protein
MSSQPPKPEFVVFVTDCNYSRNFLNKLNTKQDLARKFNVVDINKIQSIPDEIEEVPCVYDGKQLYQGTEAFKWLNENHKNVDKLILFSASCTFANRLSPKYVPASSTYCIEPWASDNGKKTWTNISPNNFYVNGVEWRRGKGAVDGIPESNQNKLKSHTTALKEAVKVILS